MLDSETESWLYDSRTQDLMQGIRNKEKDVKSNVAFSAKLIIEYIVNDLKENYNIVITKEMYDIWLPNIIFHIYGI